MTGNSLTTEAIRIIGWLLFVPILAMSQDTSAELVETFSEEIQIASDLCDIDARLLKSIVYAEDKLNVKPGEKVLDVILARSGYNSSIGIAQVKVETARWIEERLNSDEYRKSFNRVVQERLAIASSEQVRIDRLTDPQTNLIYASALVRMIQCKWKETLSARSDSVGLIGTLYSIGLLKADGSYRPVRIEAKTNEFGKTVDTAFRRVWGPPHVGEK